MGNKVYIHVIRHLFYVLLLFVCYVLQCTPGFFQLWEGKPMLTLGVVVAVAMFEGPLVGGLYGAFGGLLYDVSGASLFGFSGILAMAVGVAVGLLTCYLVRNTWINGVALMAVSCLSVRLVEFVFQYAVWGYTGVWWQLLRNVLPTVVITTLLFPISFWAVKQIHQHLQVQVH